MYPSWSDEGGVSWEELPTKFHVLPNHSRAGLKCVDKLSFSVILLVPIDLGSVAALVEINIRLEWTYLKKERKSHIFPHPWDKLNSENNHFTRLYELCSSRFAPMSFTSWRLPMSGTQLECKHSNCLLRAGWWPRHGVSLTKQAESKCTLPLADVGVDNWCRHIANTALLNWKENFSVLPAKGDLFKLNDQRRERWNNAAFFKCLFSLDRIYISICLAAA